MILSSKVETKVKIHGEEIEKLNSSLQNLQKYVNEHRDALTELIDKHVDKKKVTLHNVDEMLSKISDAINGAQYLKSDEAHDIANEEGAMHKVYTLISHLYHPLKVLKTKNPNIKKIVKELHTITVLFHDILAREVEQEEMFHIYLRHQSSDLEKTLAEMG